MSSADPNQQIDICACQPDEPDSSDFRHDAKHVPIPQQTPVETSVAQILSWPEGPEPDFFAPRSGRELQVFHVAQAFLQLAWVNPGDCDIHAEISETADKDAPRVITEVPVDGEFCPARQSLQSQLAAHGFVLNTHSGELSQPIPVEVTGLAFRDAEHQRGSVHVATLWELHPAIVHLLQ